MKHTCHLSICSKYGPAPLLLAVFQVAFWGGLGGFYLLIIVFFAGLIAASMIEKWLGDYLRQKSFGSRRGSQLIHAVQLACLLFAFGIGGYAEYKLPAEAQHQFDILNGSARSAFAQIVEAGR
jgi:hypothetical protein